MSIPGLEETKTRDDPYQVLAALRHNLAEIPRHVPDPNPEPKLSSAQQTMCDHFIAADLPNIFGDAFMANVCTLKEREGLPIVKSNVLITAPRRTGKTFAVAAYTTAAFYAIPGRDAVVVLPTTRRAQWFMETVEQMMLTLTDFHPRNVAFYPDEKRISGKFGPGDTRTVRFIAASQARGVNASSIIIDEAAIVDQDVVGKFVTPLVCTGQISLVAIFSVNDTPSFFSQFMEMDALFTVRNIELVCPQHRAEGVEHVCECNTNNRPAHLSSGSHMRDIVEQMATRNKYEKEVLSKKPQEPPTPSAWTWGIRAISVVAVVVAAVVAGAVSIATDIFVLSSID